MKRIISILSAFVALAAVSCNKVDKPQEPEQVLKNCMAYVDAEGNVARKVDFKSTVSFVSDAGMYSIYAADMPSLTKKKLVEGYSFPEKSNVVAISSIFSLLGTKVDITTETLHWLMSLQFYGVCVCDLMEGGLDAAISGGYFIFDVDTEKLTGGLEIKLELTEGGYIYCQAEGEYTPGGENQTLFEWNEMSRPVRAAFYDNTETGSNPPVMYFTNGQIDYGEEISKTTYVRLRPEASLCDGKMHDIAAEIKAGRLEFMVRDFDSEWDAVAGTISVKHIKDFEYEVNIEGCECEDRGKELSDRALRMVFSGELKDIHISRPIVNQFQMGSNNYAIKSCVVDLSNQPAAIYMLQSEGITTVEAAMASKPLIINFSVEKFGTSIGLSTDRYYFAVSYNGSRWDYSNLDTGSFICHEYNPETGLLHCQIANLCLASNYSTVLKMEYKGTPVYIK